MRRQTLEDVIRNVDVRLSRVEQILPTLSTRDEMHAAIREAVAPLATKAELTRLATKDDLKLLATKEELKPLATKEELKLLATKEELKPLATKQELTALALEIRQEVRGEGERARRHAVTLFEDLRDDIRLVLEHLVALTARVDVLTRR